MQFVINSAAGNSGADCRRAAIERALHALGWRGELHLCRPDSLRRMAQDCARRAFSTRTAVVSVGGDGTLNAVAQAAHAGTTILSSPRSPDSLHFAAHPRDRLLERHPLL